MNDIMQFGPVNNYGPDSITSQGNSGHQTIGRTSHTTVQPPGSAAPEPQDAVPGRPAPPADKARNVFMVYGRDEEVRREMFGLLRKLDLHPLEWEDLVQATGQTAPFLGDVVALAPAQAQAALVLLTPDDQVRLHADLVAENDPEYERWLIGQARPNVLLELGMVLMAYPGRTLIVEIGHLRPIADLGGRNVIRFDGTEVAVGKIVQRLKDAGCKVNDAGSDWREIWPYRGLSAYRRS